jgi:sulfur oxidation c-type cytochrome SoxA
VLEEGRKLVNRKFRNGRSIAACFPNGGRRVAATYPQYDARLKRIVTLEIAVNQCLKTHAEPLLDATDPRTMGAVTAYLRSLANGQKVAIRVPAAAEERFAQGARLYFTRMGQRNFACASCHVQGAGRYYADVALSPAASVRRRAGRSSATAMPSRSRPRCANASSAWARRRSRRARRSSTSSSTSHLPVAGPAHPRQRVAPR